MAELFSSKFNSFRTYFPSLPFVREIGNSNFTPEFLNGLMNTLYQNQNKINLTMSSVLADDPKYAEALFENYGHLAFKKTIKASKPELLYNDLFHNNGDVNLGVLGEDRSNIYVLNLSEFTEFDTDSYYELIFKDGLLIPKDRYFIFSSKGGMKVFLKNYDTTRKNLLIDNSATHTYDVVVMKKVLNQEMRCGFTKPFTDRTSNNSGTSGNAVFLDATNSVAPLSHPENFRLVLSRGNSIGTLFDKPVNTYQNELDRENDKILSMYSNTTINVDTDQLALVPMNQFFEIDFLYNNVDCSVDVTKVMQSTGSYNVVPAYTDGSEISVGQPFEPSAGIKFFFKVENPLTATLVQDALTAKVLVPFASPKEIFFFVNGYKLIPDEDYWMSNGAFFFDISVFPKNDEHIHFKAVSNFHFSGKNYYVFKEDIDLTEFNQKPIVKTTSTISHVARKSSVFFSNRRFVNYNVDSITDDTILIRDLKSTKNLEMYSLFLDDVVTDTFIEDFENRKSEIVKYLETNPAYEALVSEYIQNNPTLLNYSPDVLYDEELLIPNTIKVFSEWLGTVFYFTNMQFNGLSYIYLNNLKSANVNENFLIEETSSLLNEHIVFDSNEEIEFCPGLIIDLNNKEGDDGSVDLGRPIIDYNTGFIQVGTNTSITVIQMTSNLPLSNFSKFLFNVDGVIHESSLPSLNLLYPSNKDIKVIVSALHNNGEVSSSTTVTLKFKTSIAPPTLTLANLGNFIDENATYHNVFVNDFVWMDKELYTLNLSFSSGYSDVKITDVYADSTISKKVFSDIKPVTNYFKIEVGNNVYSRNNDRFVVRYSISSSRYNNGIPLEGTIKDIAINDKTTTFSLDSLVYTGPSTVNELTEFPMTFALSSPIPNASGDYTLSINSEDITLNTSKTAKTVEGYSFKGKSPEVMYISQKNSNFVLTVMDNKSGLTATKTFTIVVKNTNGGAYALDPSTNLRLVTVTQSQKFKLFTPVSCSIQGGKTESGSIRYDVTTNDNNIVMYKSNPLLASNSLISIQPGEAFYIYNKVGLESDINKLLNIKVSDPNDTTGTPIVTGKETASITVKFLPQDLVPFIDISQTFINNDSTKDVTASLNDSSIDGSKVFFAEKGFSGNTSGNYSIFLQNLKLLNSQPSDWEWKFSIDDKIIDYNEFVKDTSTTPEWIPLTDKRNITLSEFNESVTGMTLFDTNGSNLTGRLPVKVGGTISYIEDNFTIPVFTKIQVRHKVQTNLVYDKIIQLNVIDDNATVNSRVGFPKFGMIQHSEVITEFGGIRNIINDTTETYRRFSVGYDFTGVSVSNRPVNSKFNVQFYSDGNFVVDLTSTDKSVLSKSSLTGRSIAYYPLLEKTTKPAEFLAVRQVSGNDVSYTVTPDQLCFTKVSPTTKGSTNTTDKYFRGICVIQEHDNNISGYPTNNTIVEVFHIANPNYFVEIGDIDIYVSSYGSTSANIFNEKTDPSSVKLVGNTTYVFRFYPDEIKVSSMAHSFKLNRFTMGIDIPNTTVGYEIVGYIHEDGTTHTVPVLNSNALVDNTVGIIVKALSDGNISLVAGAATDQGYTTPVLANVNKSTYKTQKKTYSINAVPKITPDFIAYKSVIRPLDQFGGWLLANNNETISISDRFVEHYEMEIVLKEKPNSLYPIDLTISDFSVEITGLKPVITHITDLTLVEGTINTIKFKVTCNYNNFGLDSSVNASQNAIKISVNFKDSPQSVKSLIYGIYQTSTRFKVQEASSYGLQTVPKLANTPNVYTLPFDFDSPEIVFFLESKLDPKGARSISDADHFDVIRLVELDEVIEWSINNVQLWELTEVQGVQNNITSSLVDDPSTLVELFGVSNGIYYPTSTPLKFSINPSKLSKLNASNVNKFFSTSDLTYMGKENWFQIKFNITIRSADKLVTKSIRLPISLKPKSINSGDLTCFSKTIGDSAGAPQYGWSTPLYSPDISSVNSNPNTGSVQNSSGFFNLNKGSKVLQYRSDSAYRLYFNFSRDFLDSNAYTHLNLKSSNNTTVLSIDNMADFELYTYSGEGSRATNITKVTASQVLNKSAGNVNFIELWSEASKSKVNTVQIDQPDNFYLEFRLKQLSDLFQINSTLATKWNYLRISITKPYFTPTTSTVSSTRTILIDIPLGNITVPPPPDKKYEEIGNIEISQVSLTSASRDVTAIYPTDTALSFPYESDTTDIYVTTYVKMDKLSDEQLHSPTDGASEFEFKFVKSSSSVISSIEPREDWYEATTDGWYKFKSTPTIYQVRIAGVVMVCKIRISKALFESKGLTNITEDLNTIQLRIRAPDFAVRLNSTISTPVIRKSFDTGESNNKLKLGFASQFSSFLVNLGDANPLPSDLFPERALTYGRFEYFKLNTEKNNSNPSEFFIKKSSANSPRISMEVVGSMKLFQTTNVNGVETNTEIPLDLEDRILLQGSNRNTGQDFFSGESILCPFDNSTKVFDVTYKDNINNVETNIIEAVLYRKNVTGINDFVAETSRLNNYTYSLDKKFFIDNPGYVEPTKTFKAYYDNTIDTILPYHLNPYDKSQDMPHTVRANASSNSISGTPVNGVDSSQGYYAIRGADYWMKIHPTNSSTVNNKSFFITLPVKFTDGQTTQYVDFKIPLIFPKPSVELYKDGKFDTNGTFDYSKQWVHVGDNAVINTAPVPLVSYYTARTYDGYMGRSFYSNGDIPFKYFPKTSLRSHTIVIDAGSTHTTNNIHQGGGFDASGIKKGKVNNFFSEGQRFLNINTSFRSVTSDLSNIVGGNKLASVSPLEPMYNLEQNSVQFVIQPITITGETSPLAALFVTKQQVVAYRENTEHGRTYVHEFDPISIEDLESGNLKSNIAQCLPRVINTVKHPPKNFTGSSTTASLFNYARRSPYHSIAAPTILAKEASSGGAISRVPQYGFEYHKIMTNVATTMERGSNIDSVLPVVAKLVYGSFISDSSGGRLVDVTSYGTRHTTLDNKTLLDYSHNSNHENLVILPAAQDAVTFYGFELPLTRLMFQDIYGSNNNHDIIGNDFYKPATKILSSKKVDASTIYSKFFEGNAFLSNSMVEKWCKPYLNNTSDNNYFNQRLGYVLSSDKFDYMQDFNYSAMQAFETYGNTGFSNVNGFPFGLNYKIGSTLYNKVPTWWHRSERMKFYSFPDVTTGLSRYKSLGDINSVGASSVPSIPTISPSIQKCNKFEIILTCKYMTFSDYANSSKVANQLGKTKFTSQIDERLEGMLIPTKQEFYNNGKDIEIRVRFNIYKNSEFNNCITAPDIKNIPAAPDIASIWRNQYANSSSAHLPKSLMWDWMASNDLTGRYMKYDKLVNIVPPAFGYSTKPFTGVNSTKRYAELTVPSGDSSGRCSGVSRSSARVLSPETTITDPTENDVMFVDSPNSKVNIYNSTFMTSIGNPGFKHLSPFYISSTSIARYGVVKLSGVSSVEWQQK